MEERKFLNISDLRKPEWVVHGYCTPMNLVVYVGHLESGSEM